LGNKRDEGLLPCFPGETRFPEKKRRHTHANKFPQIVQYDEYQENKLGQKDQHKGPGDVKVVAVLHVIGPGGVPDDQSPGKGKAAGTRHPQPSK
jgi:hypothetical protein